jgi:hypothetical protein
MSIATAINSVTTPAQIQNCCQSERPVNQRSGNELARGPTEHADALGNSDCGREVPRWETMGGEIDSRDK